MIGYDYEIGVYIVKSVYIRLEDSYTREYFESFALHLVWWLLLDRLSTKENL